MNIHIDTVRSFVYTLSCLLVVAGMASFFAVSYSHAQSDNTDRVVTVITVDEEIRAGTYQFLERALLQAERDRHDFFILEINTPGGLLSATENISRLLVDSEIPTVVYVYKDTGWAFSAGVFILLSADIAAAHPSASLGAASPVLGSGGDAGEKTINATTAWMRTLAERNGRDADIAERFITENSTYSGSAAYEVGLVDYVAVDREELFLQLGVEGVQVVAPKPTMIESTLSFFSIPYLVPLLLTLGSLGLFLAFRTGEIEVVGGVSFVILLLGLWGAGMIELSALGVTILAVGIILVLVELFLAGSAFGASGVLGVAAIIFGIAMFAQEPLFPDVFSYGLFPALVALFGACLVILFAVSYFTASTIRQPHAVGAGTMIGRSAAVTKPLVPKGVIMIDGERYTAKLRDGEVSVGDEVVIVAMEGNIAIVTPKV